jgi:hypothetical protein
MQRLSEFIQYPAVNSIMSVVASCFVFYNLSEILHVCLGAFFYEKQCCIH